MVLKNIPPEERRRGRRRRLRTQLGEAVAKLAGLPPGEEESCKLQSQPLFDALTAAVRARGPELVALSGAVVYQLVVEDAGIEGRFILDLKHGQGMTEQAREDSDADCVVSMTDVDMRAWWEGELDGLYGFLSGRIKIPRGREHFATWTLEGGMVLHTVPLLKVAREGGHAPSSL
jgi:hypothetical protein